MGVKRKIFALKTLVFEVKISLFSLVFLRVLKIMLFMSSVVSRAYRYRFYPTPNQISQLAKTFGCTRFIDNYFREEKRRRWEEAKERLSYTDTAKLLTQLKKENSTIWLNEVSNVCLQQTLRSLDKAYRNFFKKRARYPKPKKKRSKQSTTYMRNAFRFKNGQLFLAKQNDPLAIRWSRPLPDGSIPSSVTVTLDSAGRYYISILVEEEVAPLPQKDTIVGIDLGLKSAVTTSDGGKRSILVQMFLKR